jgi:hypothetical protein
MPPLANPFEIVFLVEPVGEGRGAMKNQLLRSVVLSMLLVPWGGYVSAEETCVGCACALVLVKVPCGTDMGNPLESTATTDSNGDAFVCWLNGEQPDSEELGEICGAHCDSLPTPPPSECIDNMQVIPRHVVQQIIGPCGSFCPPDESGACNDGVNNDAYLDDVTNCADADCTGEAVCRAAAPTTSNLGLGAVLAALFFLGTFRLVGAARTS